MPERNGKRNGTAETALETAHLMDDLGSRSARGGAVMIVGQGIKLLAQFGAVAVLARTLNPRDFGLIAMAATSIVILELIRELGLSAATIQRNDISHGQVSALFWVNVLAGSALAGLLFACAPLAAAFYGEPELTAVIRWLSLGFVISGVTVQHWALLRRQMRFTTIAAIEVSAELAGFAAAVGMALAGDRYWALVGQRLIATLWTMAGVWICCRWRPGWTLLRVHDLEGLIQFGMSVTGSSILTAVSRSVDQLLVGRLFGPSVLGQYERSAKVILTPLNSLNAPLYAVAMPALSRLADQPERFRHAVGAVIERIAMVVTPGAVITAATADWLTTILFGPNWGETARFVACFALIAVVQSLIAAMGLIYLPLGRAQALLRSTAIDTALCILCVVLGLPFGAFGVAASLLIGSLAVRLPAAFWLASRYGPVRLKDLYIWILPSIAAASAAASAAIALRGLSPSLSLGAHPSGLIVILPAGAIAALAAFMAIPRSRRILHSGTENNIRLWKTSTARPE